VKFLADELEALESAHLRRSLRQHDDQPGRLIEVDAKPRLNFSSNNYLGLALRPELVEAARESLEMGTGSTASRLVTGNLGLHEDLELALAKFHGCEAVRLFNSGYQANIGLISAVAGPGDLILSDQLNHASVIDGCRLSKAEIRVYPHSDPQAVAAELQASHSGGRRFVISDSVFSMDGDMAPLRELREVCDQHEAFLIVDEAHAVGALGPTGAGICAMAGIRPDALVGGLGKSFGSMGGYVAGSVDLCEFLLNRARSFVFSTALPPAVAAASLAAVALLSKSAGDDLRATLNDRIDQMRDGLQALSLLSSGAGQSPIFPILTGSPAKTLECSQGLLDRGFFCQGIRPPTVEKGKSRLRVALSALHQPEDVEELLAALSEVV